MNNEAMQNEFVKRFKLHLFLQKVFESRDILLRNLKQFPLKKYIKTSSEGIEAPLRQE